MSSLARSLLYSALLLFFFPGAVAAQQGNPIQLSADQGEVDYGRKTSSYSGNVILNQGDMEIRGDNLALFFDQNNELLRMSIHGQPATFEQSSKDEDNALKTKALRIDYELQPNRKLRLTGNAELWQGFNRFNGDTIEYDFKTDIVRALGDESSNGRVNATIYQQTSPTDGEND